MRLHRTHGHPFRGVTWNAAPVSLCGRLFLAPTGYCKHRNKEGNLTRGLGFGTTFWPPFSTFSTQREPLRRHASRTLPLESRSINNDRGRGCRQLFTDRTQPPLECIGRGMGHTASCLVPRPGPICSLFPVRRHWRSFRANVPIKAGPLCPARAWRTASFAAVQ